MFLYLLFCNHPINLWIKTYIFNMLQLIEILCNKSDFETIINLLFRVYQWIIIVSYWTIWTTYRNYFLSASAKRLTKYYYQLFCHSFEMPPPQLNI